MLAIYSLVVSCLMVAVNCVYIPKTSKMTLPSISQSLVNLGKMDFSFYINTPDASKSNKKSSRSRQEEMPSGCACNSMKDFIKAPEFFPASDIFNKIISSNDMFHRSKEPMMSSLCCNSDEETTIIIEPQRPMPMQSNMLRSGLPIPSGMPIPFPFNLESLVPPSHFKSNPEATNTKTFEIVFFADPKMKVPAPKKDISYVGKDNFKLFNLSSFLPLSQIVKKDLNKSTPKPKAENVQNTIKPTTIVERVISEKVIPEINNNHIVQNATDNKILENGLLL